MATFTQRIEVDCESEAEYATALSMINTWVAWWESTIHAEVISEMVELPEIRRVTFTMTTLNAAI